MQYLTQAQDEINKIVFLNLDEKTDLMEKVLESNFRSWKECLRFINAEADKMRGGDNEALDYYSSDYM